MLAQENWDFQDYWNELENQLISVVDKIAPLTRVINKELPTTIPNFIKQKINQRKRLLKSNRLQTTVTKLERSKTS